jgi:antitoxin HicB
VPRCFLPRALGGEPFREWLQECRCAVRWEIVFARVHQEKPVHAGSGFGSGAKAAEGVGAMSKKYIGSSIDDFLKEEGVFEEAQAEAVKEVVAWQLSEAMQSKRITKNKMATLLKASRTQVDRILDPKNDITLSNCNAPRR